MYKKSVVISDQHIPYQDKVANRLVFDFIEEFKPDYVDILGDLIDFWNISKFLRDPSRRGTIQDDIDATQAYLAELRNMAPKAKITLHYGNHMDRLRKYIWTAAPELACIRSLDLKWMLGSDKYGIRCIEEAEGYDRRGDLVLTHGTVVSSESGYTAHRNLKKYGISVICGHTHRLGSVYRTDLRGTVGAWENGCLCDFNLVKQWGRELPNWSLGFSVIYSDGHRFQVDQIPIIGNKMLYGGKENAIREP